MAILPSDKPRVPAVADQWKRGSVVVFKRLLGCLRSCWTRGDLRGWDLQWFQSWSLLEVAW